MRQSRTGNAVVRKLAELAQTLGLETKITVVPRLELSDIYNRLTGRNSPAVDGTLDGFYDPSSDTVYLNREIVGTALGTKVTNHEVGHALTETAIQRVDRPKAGDPPVPKHIADAVAELHSIFAEARDRITSDPNAYWRDSLSEFIAESWANEALQKLLANTPSTRTTKLRNILGNLWDAIAGLFGTTPRQRTMLHDVLGTSTIVMEWSVAETKAKRGGRAPVAHRTYSDDPVERLLERMAERSRNVDIPRSPDSQVNKEDTAIVEASVEVMARRGLYGERKQGDVVTARGQATPLEDGTYQVTTDLGFSGIAQNAEDARLMLGDNGIRATLSGEVDAQKEGLAFVDQYSKSSPFVRRIANTVRSVVGRVNPVAGELMGTRTLTALNWTMTNLGSQYYFLDKMDGAVEALSGTNPQLSLRIRNAMRESSVVGRFDKLGDLGRKIADVLNESGVADVELASMYLVAEHVPQRNERFAGKEVPGMGGRVYGADITGFKFNGKVGNEAATAFMASLTADQKAVLSVVSDTYAQAKQYALAFQLQSGLINHDQYVTLGGMKDDGTVDARAWDKYIPLKDYRSVEMGRKGKIGQGQGGREMDYSKQMYVAFRDLEQAVKAGHRNAAYTEMARTARTYPQLMDARIQAKKASITTRGKSGDGVTWNTEDFRSENSLVFFENGERKTMTFADPDMQAYIKSTHATPGTAEQVASTVTHLMAQTRTTFAPAFWAQAVAWDTMMTVLGMENAAGGTLTSSESLRVSRRSLALMPSAMRRLAQRGIAGDTADPFLKLYNAKGGGVAPGSRTGLDEVMTRFNQNVNPLNNTIDSPRERAAAAGARAMTVIHTTEDMARFSAFQAYVEFKADRKFTSYDALTAWAQSNPAVLDQALDVSRRITGDFSDKGTMTWPRALFMFFSPTVAGIRQLSGVAQTRTGQFGLATLFILGGALATGAISDADDEDEDGGSRYLRREGRGRAIPINDTIQFPLAPEARAAFVAGESLAAASAGKISWGDAVGRISGAIVDSFSPLNVPDADQSSEATFVGLSPSIMQPMIVAFMGIDSFGNSTEVDKGMVRDADGQRVLNPANAERGRSRDPQWTKDVAQWTKDNVGLDLYPGRLWETLRTMGGSSLTFMQRVADPEEGLGGALTRSYQHRYDKYALRKEFDDVNTRFEQELRTNVRRDNAFQIEPGRAQNMIVMREADKLARSIKINGVSQSELYRARDQMVAEGRTEGVESIDRALLNLREMQSYVRGEALKQVKENEP